MYTYGTRTWCTYTNTYTYLYTYTYQHRIKAHLIGLKNQSSHLAAAHLPRHLSRKMQHCQPTTDDTLRAQEPPRKKINNGE
jgi:hypothetical protein